MTRRPIRAPGRTCRRPSGAIWSRSPGSSSRRRSRRASTRRPSGADAPGGLRRPARLRHPQARLAREPSPDGPRRRPPSTFARAARPDRRVPARRGRRPGVADRAAAGPRRGRADDRTGRRTRSRCSRRRATAAPPSWSPTTPGLLEVEAWRLFEVEGGGEDSLANHEKFFGDTWGTLFRELAAADPADAQRLLDASLAALARDFSTTGPAGSPASTSRWHRRTTSAPSAPTPTCGLLRSRVGPTVSFAVAALARIQRVAGCRRTSSSTASGRSSSRVRPGRRRPGWTWSAEPELAQPELARRAAVVAADGLANASPEVQRVGPSSSIGKLVRGPTTRSRVRSPSRLPEVAASQAGGGGGPRRPAGRALAASAAPARPAVVAAAPIGASSERRRSTRRGRSSPSRRSRRSSMSRSRSSRPASPPTTWSGSWTPSAGWRRIAAGRVPAPHCRDRQARPDHPRPAGEPSRSPGFDSAGRHRRRPAGLGDGRARRARRWTIGRSTPAPAPSCRLALARSPRRPRLVGPFIAVAAADASGWLASIRPSWSSGSSRRPPAVAARSGRGHPPPGSGRARCRPRRRAAGLGGEVGAVVRYALGGDESIGPTAAWWVAAARVRAHRAWTMRRVEKRHPRLGPDAGQAARVRLRVRVDRPIFGGFGARDRACARRAGRLTPGRAADLPTVLMLRDLVVVLLDRAVRPGDAPLDGDDPARLSRDLGGRRLPAHRQQRRLVVGRVGEPRLPRAVHRPGDRDRAARADAHRDRARCQGGGRARPGDRRRPARARRRSPDRVGLAEGLAAAADVGCDRPNRWAVSLADAAADSAAAAAVVAEAIARCPAIARPAAAAKLVPCCGFSTSSWPRQATALHPRPAGPRTACRWQRSGGASCEIDPRPRLTIGRADALGGGPRNGASWHLQSRELLKRDARRRLPLYK